jgi:hypothetical protein
MDWVLLGIVLLIALVGTLEVYSTTVNNPRFAGMHLKHLSWSGYGSMPPPLQA